mmetsp:Transcript_17341/g.40249  ORF Transcript_17341/g.40249 Transcript_17341/m.40249 type:complete len:237 (+) Transcript_17341:29-739(+)
MTITSQNVPANNEQSIVVPPTNTSSSSSPQDLLSLDTPTAPATPTAIVPTATPVYYGAEPAPVDPTIPVAQGPTYDDFLTASPTESAAVVPSSTTVTSPSLLDDPNQGNSQPNTLTTADNSNNQTTAPTTNTTTTTTIGVASTTTNTNSTIPKNVQTRLHNMKRNRQANQAIAATAGTVAGLVVLGPIGAVVGGVAAHSITKAAGRHREHKIRNQYSPTRQRGATNVKPLPQGVLV